MTAKYPSIYASVRALPPIPQINARGIGGCEISPQALARWHDDIQASDTAENVVSIFGTIGEDFFGEGITARRVSGILRSIGAEKDITVHINSPGGNVFEGIAIYNILREHKGIVDVKILGLAASAASVIAMAGDTIQIPKSGFLMIHNTWVVASGDRNDLREYADTLEPMDAAIAEVYADRSGEKVAVVRKMMDKETWMGGAEAVDKGFATDLIAADQVKKGTNNSGEIAPNAASHRVDLLLAKAGVTRAERRKLIGDLKSSTQIAADGTKPGAGETADEIMATLRGLSFNH